MMTWEMRFVNAYYPQILEVFVLLLFGVFLLVDGNFCYLNNCLYLQRKATSMICVFLLP